MNDFDPPLAIASIMVGFRRPWCVAGGWGIDLWLGRVTRNHSDVKIAVLREHQIELRDYLADWSLKVATRDGRLVVWKDRRQMWMLPVHALPAAGPAGLRCVFLLNESDGIEWIYRRNFDCRLNLAHWIVPAASGVQAIDPAVALLYKSARPSAKDELDFRASAQRLDAAQRDWLKLSLLRTDPFHSWIDRL